MQHHHDHNPMHNPDVKNLVIAIVAATLIMFGWQYFYERPHQLAAQKAQEQAEAQAAATKAKAETTATAPMHNDVVVSGGPRVMIVSDKLKGSLPLTGNRIDTLMLTQYHEGADPQSPAVELLSPLPAAHAYFAEIGVLPGTGISNVPAATTQWQADNTTLVPGKPVTLRWSNGAGVNFEKQFTLDDNYMFTVTTTVKNSGGAAVSVYPYGLLSRNYSDVGKHYAFMHEGPLGVEDHALNDIKYKSLRDDGDQKFEHVTGWIGLTDKYWLTALVPDAASHFDASFKYFKRAGQDAYQADLRGEELTVPPGESKSFTIHFFAGAKEVKLIDAYRAKYDIPLFDRAIDFGSLYFLTKPIFYVLSFFHNAVGNFGIAIILLTLCIKVLLFPLANKSFTSMAQMKLLVPQMNELKERHADDKMKLNTAMMELYRKEKVNPMSGCLPLLVQIPIFIALYRVLFVTIEMRHAPFYLWIHDLSIADPTTIFNLFGLIPWTPPPFLHIGVLPLIMCATMVIQQKLNPKPTDEVQAMVVGYMPYIFLALFANFPAGLVLYWITNNTLSILQQLLIGKKLKRKGLK